MGEDLVNDHLAEPCAWYLDARCFNRCFLEVWSKFRNHRNLDAFGDIWSPHCKADDGVVWSSPTLADWKGILDKMMGRIPFVLRCENFVRANFQRYAEVPFCFIGQG